MSRKTTITFITNAGGEQSLKLQDYTETKDMEFFNTMYDEAIDGSLRSNIRGTRTNINLSYRLCIESDTYKDICNNIASDLSGGRTWIYVGIDNDRFFRVTLDSGFAHKVEYANQHGLFLPVLKMKSHDLSLGITVEDWRFITESVTESRDYGLITESVTETIDYEFITP